MLGSLKCRPHLQSADAVGGGVGGGVVIMTTVLLCKLFTINSCIAVRSLSLGSSLFPGACLPGTPPTRARHATCSGACAPRWVGFCNAAQSCRSARHAWADLQCHCEAGDQFEGLEPHATHSCQCVLALRVTCWSPTLSIWQVWATPMEAGQAHRTFLDCEVEAAPS